LLLYEAGLTQKDIAERLGRSPSVVEALPAATGTSVKLTDNRARNVIVQVVSIRTHRGRLVRC
jgi:hypothetical protein